MFQRADVEAARELIAEEGLNEREVAQAVVAKLVGELHSGQRACRDCSAAARN